MRHSQCLNESNRNNGFGSVAAETEQIINDSCYSGVLQRQKPDASTAVKRWSIVGWLHPNSLRRLLTQLGQQRQFFQLGQIR
mmetsp:Transcript_10344/g.18886  ORF Transcript_10344/g.18886 Transcript_10344/m.18886 type:complete len:82 (-) Transcript_10344:34-279(-)